MPVLPAAWSICDALRLKLSWAPSEAVSLNLAYALAPQIRNPAAAAEQSGASRRYRVDDVRARLYPWTGDGAGHFAVHHNLDRAYVRLSRGPADLFIGRQAVTWGSARVVNPTDVVAPYPFTELDSEERLGVDALKAVIQLGGRSFLEAGIIAGRAFSADSGAFFLRLKAHSGQTDLAPCLALYRGNLMAGFDLAGSIGGAGTWMEAAFSGYRRQEEDIVQETTWRFSTGCDYRFSESIYAFIEYHFNGDGEIDPGNYYLNAGKKGFRDGPVYLAGKHYLAPSVSWQATPLLAVTSVPMLNLGDRSGLLSMSSDCSLSQDSHLSAGLYLPLGKRPVTDGSFVSARSEFGGYPLMLFSSYGLYF